jgi:hypothetical protein
MTIDRNRPALASITVRRLILPPGQPGPALAEAIASAVARELGDRARAAAREPAVAQAIGEAIAQHPRLAASGAGDGRQP